MAKIRIKIGDTIYAGRQIVGGNCYVSESIIGDSLGIDTLPITLRAKTDLTKTPYGTPVLYYYGAKLKGKFFCRACEQLQADVYELDCVSGVGILDEASDHYGGMYHGETLATVVADIIGGLVPYAVRDSVAGIRVYGYLPIESRRTALRQVLYPHGVSLVKDIAGDIVIDTLDIGSPVVLGRSQIKAGGTVKADSNVSGIIVMEHSYLQTATDETVTLHNGPVVAQNITSPKGNSYSGCIVPFKEPVYNLTVSGATILESGANYAVLSASGNATLTGKKYTHTTREVYAPVEDSPDKAKVIKVEDATLINATNSDALAQRVAQYYANRRIISVGMTVGTAKPGDAVSLVDPFGRPTTALLMSQDITLSGTLMADAQLVTGYAPSGGTTYKQSKLLQGTGTFIVPSGVTLLHATLIGEGERGQDGAAGEDGETVRAIVTGDEWRKGGSWSFDPGVGGDGGKAGKGGSGGKIFQVSLRVTPGQQIRYNTQGANAVFDTYTSANGAPSQVGYTDIFTGKTYALPGADGVDGGKGGDGGKADSNGIYPGQIGEDAGETPGGESTAGKTYQTGTSSGNILTHWGGGGGGGATCQDTQGNNRLPGSGGPGGNGGGGGGGAGGCWIKSPGGAGVASSGGQWLTNNGGTSADGLPGLPGGAAGILLYF